MALAIEDVTSAAHGAAERVSPGLRVSGVTLGGKDSHYVEILVSVEGCHTAPCQMDLGVFRNVSKEQLQGEIASAMQAHLDTLR